MAFFLKSVRILKRSTIFLSKIFYDLLVLLLVSNFSIAFSFAGYFQELSRISSKHLIENMEISDDGRFALTLTYPKEKGDKAYILVYPLLKSGTEKNFLGKPINVTTSTFLAPKNFVLLENNRVFVSSASNNKSTIISDFEIKDNGNLTLIDQYCTEIPDHGKQYLTGYDQFIFLKSSWTLYSFNTKKYSRKLSIIDQIRDGLPFNYPGQNFPFFYAKPLRMIFVINNIGNNPDDDYHLAWACQVNASGHFQNSGLIQGFDREKNYVALGVQVLSEALLIYLYDYGKEIKGGYFRTYNIKNHSDATKVLDLKITNFIPDKGNTRLFYASAPNQFHKQNQLGVFSIKKGVVGHMLDAMEVPTDNFIKLALLPDGCHILAATEKLDGSGNGSLVLYRINDPEIGCSTERASQVPLNLSISSSVILLTITGLVTGGVCYWLRKQGAKKGYMPIGTN